MKLVALITDFGQRDTYVAELKLALWRHGPPDLSLLDVTHDIPPGDIAAAGWVLQRIWRQTPPHTVHLGVVDPGVGTARPALAVQAGDRFFVGPGNGLAAFLAATPDLRVVRLDATALQPPPGLSGASTFHGRDLFAPAAAHLAAGRPLADLGAPGGAADLGQELLATTAATVVWIDRFGNLITNVPRTGDQGRRLDAGATLTVAGHPVRGPVAAFAEAATDELVWYWGSGDTLEIALDGASAAMLLEARVGLVFRLPTS